jgi:hypothetical protein
LSSDTDNQPQGDAKITVSIPSPTGGWNKKDSLGTMDQQDAIVMDNFISTGGYVKLRTGFKQILDTEANPNEDNLYSPIESLVSYVSGSQKHLLFSRMGEFGKNAFIYRISDDLSTYENITPSFGLKGARFKDLLFQRRLFLVSNGTDEPIVYDGTTITKHGFTADKDDDLTFSDLTDIASYNKRLYFTEKGSLRLWFTSDMAVISGKLEYLDLGDYATKGGELYEIEEWTRTGENDLSSMLVVVSSEGEVFLFSGTDPTSEEDWKLAGTYQLPSPVGFHCATRMMDELIFATRGGYYTAGALTSAKDVNKEMAITDKIRGAIDGLKAYYNNTGWQVVYMQSNNLLIINIPTSEKQSVQFICNMENETWSRFTGIPAFSFTSFGDDIYFGGKDGGIFKMFEGGNDNGLAIGGVVQQAFTTFDEHKQKHVKSISLMVGSAYSMEIKVQLSTDFNAQPPCSIYTEGVPQSSSFAVWDKSEWDEDNWGVETKAEFLDIQTLNTFVQTVPGRYISIGMRIEPNVFDENDVVWHSTTFTYETCLQ